MRKDRRTGRHGEADSRFSQFSNAPEKKVLTLANKFHALENKCWLLLFEYDTLYMTTMLFNTLQSRWKECRNT
jgi:hypothetical protein